jgi:hypothetical protein
MRQAPLLAVVASLLTLGLFQVVLYLYVMQRDRSHITQAGLGLLGLVPFLGAYVLMEQALYEKGYIERIPGPARDPEPSAQVVGTVSKFRGVEVDDTPPLSRAEQREFDTGEIRGEII